MTNSKFISFEGCEGVGKSTQVRLLREYLEKTNQDVIYIREPGGTNISEQIRKILLNPENINMQQKTEMLLYISARVQLINEVIKPALKKGQIVLCDRYVDSTIAYQGVARNIGIENVIKLHEIVCDGFYPEITIFLDLDPELAFKRKGGFDKNDRLESEGLAFHKQVYKGYKEVAKRFPERVVSIVPKGTKFETNEYIIETLRNKGCIK